MSLKMVLACVWLVEDDIGEYGDDRVIARQFEPDADRMRARMDSAMVNLPRKRCSR
jgi:hypothetical protein